MADPYSVLGVPQHADEAQVRSAYRELLMDHHPDQGGSTERFMEIKDAYERIVDGGSITDSLTEGGGAVAKRRRVTATGTAVRIDGGLELVAEADGLVVRLTALTEDLQAKRMLPSHVEHGRRLGACFHVINDTGRPLTWKARRVRFLDDGGEPHLPSVYRPKEGELPDRWRGDDVDVEHGESVRSFILSRTLPEDADVGTVVYDPQSSTGTAYRVEFDVDRAVRDELDRAPFQ